MARRATLTQETLGALGVDKLAKLILDEVQQNAPFKRIITAARSQAQRGQVPLPGSSIGASPVWSERGVTSRWSWCG